MASVSHDIADIFCHASVEHVEEDDHEDDEVYMDTLELEMWLQSMKNGRVVR